MWTDFPQEEKEQLIEYRSTVASLVGRAKTVVQLRPRSTDTALGSTTPVKAICDYRQIEVGSQSRCTMQFIQYFEPFFSSIFFT